MKWIKYDDLIDLLHLQKIYYCYAFGIQEVEIYINIKSICFLIKTKGTKTFW
jgi:hypothetical protein